MSRLLLAAFLAFATAAQAAAIDGKTLVAYSFDDSAVQLDTQALYFFQNAKGHVGFSSEFAWSGYRSIELQEEQFDEEFTELQGRFPAQRSGVFRFHFAILVENPEEEINIAVAGPEHFRVKKDGIAFWLHTEKGILIHETDGIPRKLFPVNPFQWYFFDIVYDIDKGEYDLFVDTEADAKPVLELRDQPNSSHSPASAVDRFSFIGDLGDRSRAHYFIDDVVLSQFPSRESARMAVAEERARNRNAFAASGAHGSNHSGSNSSASAKDSGTHRRKGYLDAFLEMQAALRQRPQCLPATAPEDFGLDQGSLAAMLEGHDAQTLEAALEKAAESATHSHELRGIRDWMSGCVLLRTGRASDAAQLFKTAMVTRPGTLLNADLALALAVQGDAAGAREILVGIESQWANDPRLIVLKSFLQSLAGDFDPAKSGLDIVAGQMKELPDTRILSEFLAGDKTDGLIEALMRDFPADWRKRLDDLFIAQNFYYNLVWSSKFSDAKEYARAMYEGYVKLNVRALSWRERQADAAYFGGELDTAAALYEELLKSAPKKRVVWRKLLDVVHQLGDVAREREVRRRFAAEFPRKGNLP